MANTDVQVLIKLKDELSSGLKKVSTELDKSNKKFTALGTVLGTVSKAFVAMGVAVGASAVALGVTAVKSAIEAEAEMAKVNAVLKNLTVTANGQKQSFEQLQETTKKVSSSFIKLGFDDEEAAMSFTKMLKVTGDVTTAQKAMGLAADFARFANMDLASATTQVSLGLQGSGRMLKQWNIDIKDGATQTEAMNIMMKTFGGTSTDYAKTTAGAIDVLKVAWTNLLEQAGAPFLTMLSQVLTQLNSFMISLEENGKVAKAVTDSINWVTTAFQNLWKWLTDIWNLISQFIIPTWELLRKNVSEMMKELGFNNDQLKTLYDLLKVIGYIILSVVVVAANLLLLALNALVLLVRATIVVWKEFLNIIKAIADGFTNLVEKVKSYIDWIKRIPTNITTTISQVTKKISGKATGGYVNGGQTYLVGERGPELFTPPTSGRIQTNEQTKQTPTSTVNLNLYVGMYAGSEVEKRNIAEELYKGLVKVAGMQSKSVAELLGA